MCQVGPRRAVRVVRNKGGGEDSEGASPAPNQSAENRGGTRFSNPVTTLAVGSPSESRRNLRPNLSDFSVRIREAVRISDFPVGISGRRLKTVPNLENVDGRYLRQIEIENP